MRKKNPQRPRIQRTLTLAGRTYLLHQRVGRFGRCHRATIAGADGLPLMVHEFTHAAGQRDKFNLLKGLSETNRNLPLVNECITVGDTVYVVTRWVPGRTLWEYLEQGRARHPRRLTVSSAVPLFNGLVQGLFHLNQHDHIVHGDLHPENLIVRPKSTLVIIDFSHSWFLSRTMMRGGPEGLAKHINTQYAAPEVQICSRAGSAKAAVVDFRADQFSAAVIFYEMLTFQVPYQGAGGLAGVPGYRELYDRPPEPPSQLAPDRDRLNKRTWNAIDEFVLKGLALDPNERFLDPQEWRNRLRPIVDGVRQPSRMQPESAATLKVLDKVEGIGRQIRRLFSSAFS